VFVDGSIHIPRAGDSKIPHFEEAAIWQGFEPMLITMIEEEKNQINQDFLLCEEKLLFTTKC